MSSDKTTGELSSKNLTGAIVPPTTQPSPAPPLTTAADPKSNTNPTTRSTTRKEGQLKSADAPIDHTTPRQGSTPLASAEGDPSNKGPIPPNRPQRRPTNEQGPTDESLSQYPPLPPDLTATQLEFLEFTTDPRESQGGLDIHRSVHGTIEPDDDYDSGSDEVGSGDDAQGSEGHSYESAEDEFTVIEKKKRGGAGHSDQGHHGYNPSYGRGPHHSSNRLTKDKGRDARGLGRSREGHDVPGSYRDDERRQGGSGAGAASGSSVLSSLGLGTIASNLQAKLMPTPEQQIRALKDELKATRDENKSLSRHVRHTRDEFNQAVRYIHHLQDREHHHEQDKSRMREAIAGLENESSVLRRELADAKNLANIRGKELLGSQVFLTKADTLSVSEVSDKLNNLNEEIFQAAALLGETLIPQEYPEEQRTPAATSVSEILGPNIISMLVAESRKEVPEVNPLLVQVVLQVFLVSFCARLIQKWCPEDLEKSRTLETIYESIRGTEEQAVFGRWRALTRSRLTIHPESWQGELFESLERLLVVAGWKIASEADRKGFGQKVKPIFKAVEDIRTALGEKVTSADFEVFHLIGGSAFNGGYMEDAYGDAKSGPPSKKAPAEVVAGTVGLGLKRAMKERNAMGHLQFANVVSAKIALESTLREALEPPPPKKSRGKSSKPDKGGQSKASEVAAAAAAARTSGAPPPTSTKSASQPKSGATPSPPGISGPTPLGSSPSPPSSSATPAPNDSGTTTTTDDNDRAAPPPATDEGGQADSTKSAATSAGNPDSAGAGDTDGGTTAATNASNDK